MNSANTPVNMTPPIPRGNASDLTDTKPLQFPRICSSSLWSIWRWRFYIF